MFRFEFSADQEKCDIEKNREWRKCEEVVYEENMLSKGALTSDEVNTILLSDLILKYLKHEVVMELIHKSQNSSILKAEQQHSDLLPAIYEGNIMIYTISCK